MRKSILVNKQQQPQNTIQQSMKHMRILSMCRIIEKCRITYKKQVIYILKFNQCAQSLNRVKMLKFASTFHKIRFRLQNIAWKKLQNQLNRDKKQKIACQRMLFIYRNRYQQHIRSCFNRLKVNMSIYLGLQKNQNNMNKKLIENSSKQKNNFQIISSFQKMSLSSNLINVLKKLIKYNKEQILTISSTELKQSCEEQKKRLFQVKNADKQLKNKQFDNQLWIIVILNHIRVINQLQANNQAFLSIGRSNTTNLTIQVRQKSNSVHSSPGGSNKRYNQLANEFEASELQLKHIMEKQTVDYDELVSCLRKQINSYKAQKKDPFINSRIKLSQIIINLIVNYSNGKLKKSQHHYFEIVDQLVNKVKELSTICQQIPQLQIFKRTLDLSQVTHQEHFIKIVDVLIALHRRVNQLLRIRPSQMQLYIDMFRKQCNYVEVVTSEFLQHFQTNETQYPIVFEPQKHNFLQQFKPIHKNIVILSKKLVQQRSINYQNQQTIQRIKTIIQLFWNVMENTKSYEIQWANVKENPQLSELEHEIVSILDNCLSYFDQLKEQQHNKMLEMQQAFEKKRNQTEEYHQKLEQQINSLLTDFQNSQVENDELKDQLQKLKRQNERLKKQKDRIDELELQNLTLEKQLQQAKKRQNELLKKFQDSQSTYNENVESQYKILISQLKNQNQKIKDSFQQQAQELANLRMKLKQFQLGNLSKKDKIENLTGKIIEIQSKYSNLQEQYFTLQSKYNSKIQSQAKYKKQYLLLLEQIKQQNQQHQQQLQLLASKHSNKYSQTNQLLNDKSVLQNEISALIAQNNELKSKLNSTYSQNHSKISSLEQELARLRQQQNEHLVKLNQLTEHERSKQDLLRRIQQLQNENNQLKSKVYNLQQLINQKQIETNKLEDQLTILKNKLRQLNTAKQENQHNRGKLVKDQSYTKFLEEQVKSLEEVVNNLSQQLALIGQKYRRIEEKLAKINQQRSHLYNNGDVVTMKDKQISILKQQINNLKGTNNSLNITITSHLNHIRDRDQTIERLKSQLLTIQRQCKQQFDRIINTKIQQINRLNQQIIKLQNQIRQNQYNINNSRKYDEMIVSKDGQINYLKNINQKLQDKLRILEQSRNKEATDFRSEIQSLKRQLLIAKQQKNNQIAHLNKLLAQSKSEINIVQLKNDVQVLNRKIILVTEEKNREIQRYKLKIQTINKRLQATSNDKNQEINRLKKRLEDLEKQLKEFYQEILLAKDREINNLRQQLSEVGEIHQHRIQIEEVQKITVNTNKNYRQLIQFKPIKRQSIQIPVDGKSLEELITKLDMDSEVILQQLNQIIRKNAIVDWNPTNSRSQTQKYIEMNKQLINTCLILIKDRQQALLYLKNYPHPDHLNQLILRLLLYFSKIPENTASSSGLSFDLEAIRKNNKGSEYFYVLETFIKGFFDNYVVPMLKDSHKDLTASVNSDRRST